MVMPTLVPFVSWLTTQQAPCSVLKSGNWQQQPKPSCIRFIQEATPWARSHADSCLCVWLRVEQNPPTRTPLTAPAASTSALLCVTVSVCIWSHQCLLMCCSAIMASEQCSYGTARTAHRITARHSTLFNTLRGQTRWLCSSDVLQGLTASEQRYREATHTTATHSKAQHGIA